MSMWVLRTRLERAKRLLTRWDQEEEEEALTEEDRSQQGFP